MNRFVLIMLLIVALPRAWVAAAEGPVTIPDRDSILATLRPGHPRLLIDAAGFDSLKARIASSETLAAWYARTVDSADSLLRREPNVYRIPDGKRLLSVSRSVLDRVYHLALAYRLEGDRKYLDRAWKELQAAAAFKDWNPSHFLDTAEMTHAFAIGYDWLYDDWTDSQRATIREAIVGHGLTPGLKSYRGERGGGWFPRSVHNWNQVCNGGLTAGALAVADEVPELAAEIVHSALGSIPRAMAEYAPDGAYHEGPGYWGYGTSYNVLMIAVLESALGSDFGLTRFEGFDQTVRFPMQMTGPTGLTFNFADAGAGRPSSTFTMFWLADRFGHPAVTRFTERFVRGSPRDLIWYREPGADRIPPPAKCTYWRGVEAVSLRSSWDDPEASWIVFKGDRPGVNHGQADLGSFVLEMLGERFAVDLGADNYNLPGYFDGRKGRWHFYRNRAEGHNTLVIEPGAGPDQAIRGRADVLRFDDDPASPFAIMDLTAAYAEHAERVHRGIRLLDGTVPVVQDAIELKAPSRLWWFMHTPAEVEIASDGRSATLRLNDRQLVASVLGPDDARFRVMEAAPLPTSPTVEGQRSNPGIRKLAIYFDDFTKGRITVAFTPAGHDRPTAVSPLEDWKAR